MRKISKLDRKKTYSIQRENLSAKVGKILKIFGKSRKTWESLPPGGGEKKIPIGNTDSNQNFSPFFFVQS